MNEPPQTVRITAVFNDSNDVKKLVATQPPIHQPQPMIKDSWEPQVSDRK
jgi:hypothetical protein